MVELLCLRKCLRSNRVKIKVIMKRKTLKIYLIVLYIFTTIISIVGLPFLFLLSMFLFDSPESKDNIAVMSIFYLIIYYPIFYLLGLVLSIVFYKQELKNWMTVTVSLIPYYWLTVLAGIYIYTIAV